MKIEDLDEFYSRFKYGEDIFHQLMAKRVKDILLIATFYDAFIFEQDGRLSEQINGEYRQLNLSTAPRVTSVATGSDALKKLNEQSFDLVIMMMRIGDMTPFQLAKAIKEQYKNIPILLLLNVQSDYVIWESNEDGRRYIDDVFLWNGDTKLFLAMVKSIEDKLNADFDTVNGLVRVVLLVEDSVHYYSLFLPTLYSIIMKQTQKLIEEEVSDINKRLRMRVRPKVILAHNYEDAIEAYERYKEYILCVISDVRFLKDHVEDAEAGIKLIKTIMSDKSEIPIILQSSEEENKATADEHGVFFLNKNSKHLFSDLRNYMEYNLGFGNFVFRNQYGDVIDFASNIADFERKIKIIPEESLVFHSRFNHFSNWLIAHGEILIAKKIRPVVVEDFNTKEELREFIFHTFKTVRTERNKGKIINFDPDSLTELNQVVRLSDGSLGGKGRGLAFLNALLVTMEYDKKYQGINIALPGTAIIGTNEFDNFLENNHIIKNIFNKSDLEIDEIFLQGDLSQQLIDRLMIFLDHFPFPLAVRSSGLLEDSQAQPLAGVYRTYMLPNNHPDKNVRFHQLSEAIKLVYASVFQTDTRKYLDSLNFKSEDEKMAVILQEIVGNIHGEQYYYPHISGVAQSYNFYPTSYIEHSDGTANIALGLGKSVVDGKLNYRFCPKYPQNEMLPPEEMMRSSQKEFYALDLKNNDFELIKGEESTLSKLDIRCADSHGTIKYLASTWDYQNERLTEDTTVKGFKVLTFFSILKYNYFPLAQILTDLLEMGEISFGIPVEIEYALNLEKDPKYGLNPTFYILQIRPLAVASESYHINPQQVVKKDLMLYTEHGMGNGIIHDIYDIIFLDSDAFDKTKTQEMANEISLWNEQFKTDFRKYVLIGPGRWGTRDRFLGIPVKWANINMAKAIIECGLSDFIIEASQGTHFFHNLVAMNVGYFTIPFYSETDFIDWVWLKEQTIFKKGTYFVHLRFDHPLIIKMDGKTGLSIIQK